MQLGHGGLAGETLGIAVVVARGRRVDENVGRFDFESDVGQLMGHSLKVRDRPTGGGAGGGVAGGDAQGRFSHPQGKGADTGPEQVQGLHGDLEAVVDLPLDILLGDIDRLAAATFARHHECGHSALARTHGGASEQGVDVGIGGIGYVRLLSRDPDPV